MKVASMFWHQAETRSGPPVGAMYAAFAVALGLIGVAIGLEVEWSPTIDPITISQIGVMATTLFGVTALLCTHRAVTHGDRAAVVVAVILAGPGALWSWLTFVIQPAVEIGSAVVVVSSAGLAIALLRRGMGQARWAEVYCGLGLVALACAAGVVHVRPLSAAETVSVVLLAAASGMTCLYGTLVEIEVSGRRTVRQLVETSQRYRVEIEQSEELFHDLCSGLLSIEAASSVVDSALARSIRFEAARLRQLTRPDQPRPTSFDLADPMRHLIELHRARGSIIEVTTPPSALVRGAQADVLAIIENLLSNARRHGTQPTRIEVAETTRGIEVAVSDGGRIAGGDRLFERGTTTHPEGRGLGLHRAQSLARRNGGDLALTTDLHGRARFVLRLEAGSAPETDGAEQPAALPMPESA